MREYLGYAMTGIWLASWLFFFTPQGFITCVITGFAALKLTEEKQPPRKKRGDRK